MLTGEALVASLVVARHSRHGVLRLFDCTILYFSQKVRGISTPQCCSDAPKMQNFHVAVLSLPVAEPEVRGVGHRYSVNENSKSLPVPPNARGKRAPTARRQARALDDKQRQRAGLAPCRWGSP